MKSTFVGDIRIIDIIQEQNPILLYRPVEGDEDRLYLGYEATGARGTVWGIPVEQFDDVYDADKYPMASNTSECKFCKDRHPIYGRELQDLKCCSVCHQIVLGAFETLCKNNPEKVTSKLI